MEKQSGTQSLFVRGLLSLCRILLILGLLFYVLYHLTNGFSAQMRTETVKVYTEQLSLDRVGVIVRKETVIPNMIGGVVSYRYENGTRVNKDAKIATVYGGNNDAALVARVAQIDKTIDFLEESNFDEKLSIHDGIDASKRISELLTEISENAAKGKYGDAVSKHDALLGAFIKRDAALGSNSAVITEQLALLKEERSKLENQLSGMASSLKTSISGYFYDYTDGGEGAFDYDNITKLEPAEYEAGLDKFSFAKSNAAGKIVSLAKWYFITDATRTECSALSKGKTYELLFNASDIRIPMLLEAENIVGEEAVLVFSTYEMPKDFDFSRTQKVSVVTDTISGFRVPSKALRVVDGVVGVYIRSGNTVKFRVADVIYESGASSFISTKTEGKTLYAGDDDAENDIYCKGLSLYDNVIVSGSKDLTPDRIVN